MAQDDEWKTVAEAAKLLDRTVGSLYVWLRKPIEETNIRRMKIKQKLYLNMESLIDFEATVQTGRPRKN